MGMDAQANVFYGYNKPLSKAYYSDPEEIEELLIDTQVDFVRSGDDKYLCIKESNQYFNWDYGPRILNTKTIVVFNETIKMQWDNQLQEACKLLDMEWDFNLADWFVTCDYR